MLLLVLQRRLKILDHFHVLLNLAAQRCGGGGTTVAAIAADIAAKARRTASENVDVHVFGSRRTVRGGILQIAKLRGIKPVRTRIGEAAVSRRKRHYTGILIIQTEAVKTCVRAGRGGRGGWKLRNAPAREKYIRMRAWRAHKHHADYGGDNSEAEYCPQVGWQETPANDIGQTRA